MTAAVIALPTRGEGTAQQWARRVGVLLDAERERALESAPDPELLALLYAAADAWQARTARGAVAPARLSADVLAFPRPAMPVRPLQSPADGAGGFGGAIPLSQGREAATAPAEAVCRGGQGMRPPVVRARLPGQPPPRKPPEWLALDPSKSGPVGRAGGGE